MVKETDYIWYNGQFKNWKDSTVHLLSHGLHYGVGVFEGIRAYKTLKGTAIFRLKEHMDRLYDSADALLLKIPYKKQVFFDAVKETIAKNKLKAGYIRPIVFTGYGVMGLNTEPCSIDCSVIVWPWGTYLGEEGLKKGIKAVVAEDIRRDYTKISNAKICGNYYKSTLTKRYALAKGADEAILLDTKGFVAEGSGENIFIVKNGKLFTPNLGAILQGITRGSIMEIAKDFSIPSEEKNITKEELLLADEVFFCGTAAEVTPVREIDGTIIGKGSRGPITEKIQTKFFEITEGKDKKYESWLTYVEDF